MITYTGIETCRKCGAKFEFEASITDRELARVADDEGGELLWLAKTHQADQEALIERNRHETRCEG